MKQTIINHHTKIFTKISLVELDVEIRQRYFVIARIDDKVKGQFLPEL